MLTNTLIDNSDGRTLLKFIHEIMAEAEPLDEILIATGYWDIPGLSLLAKSLDIFLKKPNTKLKILIGSDPLFMAKYNTKPKYKGLKYPEEYIKTDIEEIEVTPEYENAVYFLLKYLDDQNKIEIHLYKKNENAKTQFLHAKSYIFIGEHHSFGIIGSSNFTQNGLIGNAELNYLEVDSKIITAEPKRGNSEKGHQYWFNEMWKNSVDWTHEFYEQILLPSTIGRKVAGNKIDFITLPPYETYIKLLIEEFGEIISFDGKIKPEDYIPSDPDFKQLRYQIEAVNQGFQIMKQHGGFILADVVGLGKTFTALMIVKRHLLETGFQRPVLIITPPAVKQSWLDSIEYFDKAELDVRKMKPHLFVTTIGSLESDSTNEYSTDNDFDLTFSKKDYGMIVVDESHRFRNTGTIMYQKLDDLIGTVTPHPYIILLSATPQNNKPEDLRNQIYLFQREHRNSTLHTLGSFGNNLEGYFAEKQRNYDKYIKNFKITYGKKIPKTDEEIIENRKALIADSEDIRARIVNPLIIRRTRTDIEKFYAADMKNQNLKFPKIKAPKVIPYEMKEELGFLFNHTIDVIAPQVSHVDIDEKGNPLLNLGTVAGEDGLGYYRYRALEFLKSEEHRKLYEVGNITVSDTSTRLAQIMEILLVKRLESSQAAFKESLHNLKRYSNNMLRMWEANKIFICPDIDVNRELSDDAIKKNGGFKQCLLVIAEKARKANKRNSGDEKNGPNQEYKQKDFLDTYIQKLKNDMRLIEELCSKWDKQTDDPKIERFIRIFDKEFFDKQKNPFQKLIIFTECIATQQALVKKLNNFAEEFKVLSITASNRDKMKDVIAANFDANYKGAQKDDYQILVTTDVLAEGVNLHRANSIVNYDSPWNATRLMQRLGRINRIGSEADEIWHYNFYPSTLGDNQINLKNRTYVKLQSFHELFGEDSQIYSIEEVVKNFGQLEFVHNFEEPESPLMPFITELRNFKEQHSDKYNEIKAITKLVTSCVKDENKRAFSHVKEIEKNNSPKTKLYISNQNRETKQIGQLEFFEALKPLIQSDAASTAINRDTVRAYQKSIMECYEKDKKNSALIMRGRKSKQNKEITQARRKMQELYTSINSAELRTMLDVISEALMHHNLALAKKVLKMDFQSHSLFDNGFYNNTIAISELYQLAQQNTAQTNTNAALSIVLIAE